MKKFSDTICRLLPVYAWLPITIVILFNMFTYYAVPFLLGSDIVRSDLSTRWDYIVPYVPFFIIFYVLSYAQWFFSYWIHCRESAMLCCTITSADIIAKFLCMICFILLPTVIVRPDIPETGILNQFTLLIYENDKPINLFPSIHCLESWLCFRGAMMMKNRRNWYVVCQLVFTLLVFASTVFVKQHFLIDIPAGILVVEIGLLISEKYGGWKLVNSLQPKKLRIPTN